MPVTLVLFTFSCVFSLDSIPRSYGILALAMASPNSVASMVRLAYTHKKVESILETNLAPNTF